jgi:hypothetical protein
LWYNGRKSLNCYGSRFAISPPNMSEKKSIYIWLQMLVRRRKTKEKKKIPAKRKKTFLKRPNWEIGRKMIRKVDANAPIELFRNIVLL